MDVSKFITSPAGFVLRKEREKKRKMKKKNTAQTRTKQRAKVVVYHRTITALGVEAEKAAASTRLLDFSVTLRG